MEKPTPKIVPSQVSQQILGAGTSPTSLFALQQSVTHSSGPLPSPEIIAGYEKILPGSADRIFKMAEKEQAYRHEMNRRNQTLQAGLTLAGQLFALLVSLTGIGGGLYLVAHDKPIAGFGIFFTSLAGIISLFFYFSKGNSSGKKKPKTDSAPQM